MNVAVCKVTLHLPENQSLKGKRRVINSLCSRIRNRFHVSIAEVGDNHLWQSATLGITCVSNNSRHADEMIDNVLAYISDSREDLDVVECERETLSGF